MRCPGGARHVLGRAALPASARLAGENDLVPPLFMQKLTMPIAQPAAVKLNTAGHSSRLPPALATAPVAIPPNIVVTAAAEVILRAVRYFLGALG